MLEWMNEIRKKRREDGKNEGRNEKGGNEKGGNEKGRMDGRKEIMRNEWGNERMNDGGMKGRKMRNEGWQTDRQE